MAKQAVSAAIRAQKRRIDRLVDAVRQRPKFMDKKLSKMKKAGPKHARASDFLWKAILRSLATWGGVGGAKNFEKNYQQVKYEKLATLSNSKRKAVLKRVFFKKYWGRYREKKLECACGSLTTIENLGGGTSASKKARQCIGFEAKMKFMRKFDGIGKKYSRNIWMDVCDPDFRNSIAVDQRLKNVLKALDPKSRLNRNYPQGEEFFLKLAKRAGVNGWYLDRLLFNFTPYFMWAIEAAD